MRRTIVVEPDLTGSALGELKTWLGITRSLEDDRLTGLLAASLSTCEAFIGQVPIEATIEETVPTAAGCERLATLPVRTVISADILENDGTRSGLATGNYSAKVDADGVCHFELKDSVDARAVIVTLTAGISEDWASLPDAIRHGIIRLAAYHYRDRDRDRSIDSPASVKALWGPWRNVSLV